MAKSRRRAASVASLIFATSPHSSPVASTTHLPTLPPLPQESMPSSPTSAFGLPPIPSQHSRDQTGGPKTKRSLKALFKRFKARDGDSSDDELDFGCSGYHSDEEMAEARGIQSGAQPINVGLGIEGFVQTALTPSPYPQGFTSSSQATSTTNVSDFASTSPSTAASDASAIFSTSSSARSSASYSSFTASSVMCSPSISQSLANSSFLPATPVSPVATVGQDYYFPHRRISTSHQRDDTITLGSTFQSSPMADQGSFSPQDCEEEEKAAIEALEAYFASQKTRAASVSVNSLARIPAEVDEYGRRASSPSSSPLNRKMSRPELRSGLTSTDLAGRPTHHPPLRARRSENCLYSAARSSGFLRSRQYDGTLQRRPAFARERSYTTSNSFASTPTSGVQSPALASKRSFSVANIHSAASSSSIEEVCSTSSDAQDTLPPLPNPASATYFSGTNIISPPTSRRGSLASGNLQRPQYTYV